MSQSPTDDTSTFGPALLRYQQGWRALNRLLHRDRSFSGHERNCAFLNLGSGEFASVSAVTGLDYPDDGRAVATCDWDFDGQLDLWFTARTAPRLRFVRNQQPTTNHFVAVRLRGNGTTTNRDAIGARVELYLAGDKTQPFIKTRHAGDGFLSQSSGWMHFGLGPHTAVNRIVVRWPGGEKEEFRQLDIDSFSVLEQGTGTARRWEPPKPRHPLLAASDEPPSTSAAARIVVPYRLPLPRLMVDLRSKKSGQGKTQAGGALEINAPTLINVWTSACTNCVAELGEWARQHETFAGRSLNVIAINADQTSAGAAQKVMDEIGFPFAWGIAKPGAIRNLDLFQRAVLDRWQPMPVPCSFLVDQRGRAVAIYKGPADVAQIISDLDLIDASPERLRAASTPFPGRWISAVPPADPLRVSTQMIDHALVGEAIVYLERFIRLPPAVTNPVRLADVHYVLAILLKSQQRKHRAIGVLRNGRRHNPDDFRIRSELGRLLGEMGQAGAASVELAAAVALNPTATDVRKSLAIALIQDEQVPAAADHLKTVLAQDPGDAVALFHLANCQRVMQEWDSAVSNYRAALQANPNMLLAANNLAFIRAAHPRSQFRDGREAVGLAEHICEQTKFRHPSFLDTLAIAYAENGQFEQAIQAARRAVELLQAQPDTADQIKPIRARLELFQNHQVYRVSW